MMKLSILLISTLLVLTRAEPPRSSYLPPQSRNQFNNAPSNQYGAPNNGFTSQSQSQPRTNYGAPSNSRTNYAAPQQPKSQYGPPQQQQQSFNQQQSYDLPLEQDFGNNFQQSAPASSYGVPSQAYGAPGSGNSFSDSYTAGGQGNNQGAYEEPAKYEFQYDVQDEPAGLDFGHQEKREGSVATGKYYVLLPDGRKQIVNYIADENGYRPTITYEETGQGGYDNNAQSGGYDNNAQSGFRGY